MLCTDSDGLRLTAPDDQAARLLDESVDRLLHFRYRMIDPLRPVLDADSFFPMAQALDAYLGGLSTDGQLAAGSAARLARFRERTDGYARTPREDAHLRAAGLMLAGQLAQAAGVLEGISLAFPRDVIALAVGHQLDLTLGDNVTLRDRIGDTLPCWDTSSPRYSCVLGMYAFGLEENGRSRQAEDLGRQAVELDTANVWAVHAVAHTFEMRCSAEQGQEWLNSWQPTWTAENQIRCHLWWHYCLYLIDQSDSAGALRIYDESLAPGRIDDAPPKLTNGSSILWRMRLEGIDTGGRFTELARAWRPHVSLPWCAFNDMHAVMCYLGAGEQAAAEALIADRRQYVSGPARHTDNAAVTAAVGLPVCEALLAFERGDYDEVLALLYPIRRRVYRCGGSNAQRDVIHQTLLEAAVRGNRQDEARCLSSERQAIRPDSPLAHAG
jgi:hypothetical protein